MVGYADSDYAVNTKNRQLTLGYVYCLNKAIVSWSSKKAKIVAVSSTKIGYLDEKIYQWSLGSGSYKYSLNVRWQYIQYQDYKEWQVSWINKANWYLASLYQRVGRAKQDLY